MEDFAAGTELASQSLRAIRENIAAINRSLSVFSTRVDQTSGKVGALTSVLKKAQSELLISLISRITPANLPKLLKPCLRHG
ncbi:hypothetical protein EAO12_29825 [Klebsiella pneumoniae]|nr:hypothetical protein EAO12_29825 [Klebsiella pneumoniae]